MASLPDGRDQGSDDLRSVRLLDEAVYLLVRRLDLVLDHRLLPLDPDPSKPLVQLKHPFLVVRNFPFVLGRKLPNSKLHHTRFGYFMAYILLESRTREGKSHRAPLGR
jgi:hypothetical protein